jgi:hypothetical protein
MDDGEAGDRCVRAAQAAIEVVRDECAGMDVEVREVGDGMFVEIPEEAAEMMDDAGESPVPLDNFTNVVEQSGFVREWLGGRSASGGIDPDPANDAYATVVHNLAATIFDDGLAFTPSELRNTPALREIAQSA